jgi:hypothetical protein
MQLRDARKKQKEVGNEIEPWEAWGGRRASQKRSTDGLNGVLGEKVG